MQPDLQMEMMPVASLAPYAANAHMGPAELVAQLAASIAELGFNVPVLVDDAGVLIAGHDFAVVGVDGECDTNDFAIPARDLEPVRGPTLIGGQSNDEALMRPDDPPAGKGRQQEGGHAHRTRGALVAERWPPEARSGPKQQGGDAAIAIGGSGADDAADLGEHLVVPGADKPSQPRTRRRVPGRQFCQAPRGAVHKSPTPASRPSLHSNRHTPQP